MGLAQNWIYNKVEWQRNMSTTNMVNLNEMDYGRWNEWDGLSTEGNKMSNEQ